MRGRLKRISEKVAGSLDEPRLSVAPLIDVCFLLLIFFMVTSTIRPEERDLVSRIPQPGAPPPQRDPLAVVIEVRGDGRVVLNPGTWEIVVGDDASRRELPALEEHLKLVTVGAKEDPVVVLRVGPGAGHQRVVDVLSVLGKAGLRTVGFEDEE